MTIKKVAAFIIFAILVIFTGCGRRENKGDTVFTIPAGKDYEVTMKRDILSLMMAYPEYVVDIERKAEGDVYVIMKSGTRILYDDKKVKDFETKLKYTDLQDMMEQVYPLGNITSLMPQNFDPGRFRVYSLLKEVYGKSKKEIQENLVPVKFGPGNYLFNESNKASEALKMVAKELIPLAQSRKDIYPYIFPANGTFNYRLIAGTNRLSPHTFGTAIDLARNSRDYWKWASREQGKKRLNSYPREIVRIFEKNNFIWGGKWGHFDILHFEYRPELIYKARYFSDSPQSDIPWYNGVPKEDPLAKKLINIIDETFE